jgi:tartrate/fumarate subfamily iron-sulfur-dependent hydro-lyase beta chain
MVVARDIAHAKLKERVDAGKGLPDYFKGHPVYYAGPAKTPTGYASGSFGPTTAGRMDSYVDQFQSLGGSMVMLAKGNRSAQVTAACKKHGGFYLGAIGGPAAILAKENIRRSRCSSTPSSAWRRLEDRGEGFPGLHPRRRQGQRLLRERMRGLPAPANGRQGGQNLKPTSIRRWTRTVHRLVHPVVGGPASSSRSRAARGARGE